MTEEMLFAAALEKKDLAERTTFLKQECGDDTALRNRIEARLRSCGGQTNENGLGRAGLPSAVCQPRRFVPPNLRGILAWASLLLALMVGILGIGRWRDTQRQRTAAEEQRDRAVKAADEAWETARRLHAVLGFMQDHILTVPRSENRKGGAGAEATIRAALDAAEPKVAAAFADKPQVEAEVRDMLGAAYFHLDNMQQAVRQWERALALQKAQLGAAHLSTLQSLNNLAEAHRLAGQLKEALPLYEEAVKLEQAHLPTDHPLLLASTNNLAVAYRDAGRFPDALPLFEKTLKLRKAQLGTAHLDTLQSMNNLAAVYWSLGQLHRSVPLFEEALRGRKSRLGADHPETLITMANLGINYRDAGRPEEAIPLLEDAVQRLQNRPGGIPNQLAWIPLELVQAYERAGQFAEAEQHHRSLLEQMRVQAGAEDARTLTQMAALGANLLHQKRYTEAELLLRDCLNIQKRKQPEAWNTFYAQSLLGGTLLGQKMYAEAEPLLVSGCQGMNERADKVPATAKVRLSEAFERLIQLYDAWGNKGKADEWRKNKAATGEKQTIAQKQGR